MPVRTARPDGPVLLMTALLVIVVTLCLQLWRPYFYLTDDSLTGFYPLAREACVSLWEGRSIAVNQHQFGGEYHLWKDAAAIALWSPWMFIFSPLALTRHHAMLVDAISLGNSLTIALAFAGSMLFLRRRLGWEASDRVIVVASLSYAFTPFNLLVGASWVGFLNAQVVYPVALAAAYARRWWLAALPMAGAWIFGLLGGHLHTTIMAVLFGGFLMALLAVIQRSWRPLLPFAVGGALAILVLSPLLAPGFAAFGDVPRSAGISPRYLMNASFPVPILLQSILFGPIRTAWEGGMPIFELDPGFSFGLAFSLASLPGIAAVILAARHRHLDGFSWCLLGLALATLIWIVHPLWLAEIHARIPLLKSLRWPFREAAVLAFAVHVLFVRHFAGLAALRSPLRLAPAALGAASMATLAFGEPPSFNAFALDRELVISGESERYWEKMRRDSDGPIRLVVGARMSLLKAGWKYCPFSALGAYNFASLYNVVNLSGYSVTPPRLPGFPKKGPIHWSGMFLEEDARYLYAHAPGLTLVVMQSLAPLRWSVAPPVPAIEKWFRIDNETGAIVAEPPPAPSSQPAVDPPPRTDFEPLSPPRE